MNHRIYTQSKFATVTGLRIGDVYTISGTDFSGRPITEVVTFNGMYTPTPEQRFGAVWLAAHKNALRAARRRRYLKKVGMM